MPTKIRLQRHGKKGRPFYHIVVADGRAPRDGRFIEKIGTYNPINQPAAINIDFDRALYWVGVGAQPTDTVRAILSYKGIMMKYHLQRGVAKGALTQEQAEAKFNEWIAGKESRITQAIKDKELKKNQSVKERREAELKVKEAKAAAIAAKNAAAQAPAATEEEAPVEEAAENTEAAE